MIVVVFMYNRLCSECEVVRLMGFFFFKQKTAYEMRISDWSSDVCSSDLSARRRRGGGSRPWSSLRSGRDGAARRRALARHPDADGECLAGKTPAVLDRKSTRLNSSH